MPTPANGGSEEVTRGWDSRELPFWEALVGRFSCLTPEFPAGRRGLLLSRQRAALRGPEVTAKTLENPALVGVNLSIDEGHARAAVRALGSGPSARRFSTEA